MEKEVEVLTGSFKGKLMLSLQDTDWEDAFGDIKWVIAVRMLGRKNLNRDLLKENLRKAWIFCEVIEFKELANNTILMILKSEEEMQRILEGGPWTFQGNLILVKRWEQGIVPSELVMNKLQLWIQLHNLPIELMKDKYAIKVTEKIGKVCWKMKAGGMQDKLKYMRNRVEVEVDSPLKARCYLERPGKDPLWITFRYEMLPTLCYGCGILGHDISRCSENKEGEEEKEWGPWLKAELHIEMDLGRTKYPIDFPVTGLKEGNGAIGEWKMMFPKGKIFVGYSHWSDHRSLILDLHVEDKCRNKHHTFKFEPMWCKDENFNGIVQHAWSDASQSRNSLVEILKDCGNRLKRWNEEKFGNMNKKITEIKSKLETLSVQERNEENVRMENSLSGELDQWLSKEELMWKQRAMTEWLKEGDKNTVFFKAKATQRFKRKIITELEDENGQKIEGTHNILERLSNYFEKLFQSSRGNEQVVWEEALACVNRKVSEDVNVKLRQRYTKEEVERALCSR